MNKALPIFAILLLPNVTFAESHTDELVSAAENMERGFANIPTQWLEMESSIGWEKMILIFGYADNASVCFRLNIIAAEDSPDRRFRCTPAN